MPSSAFSAARLRAPRTVGAAARQIFLDRSGEEIRRRTFELTDPSGRELCLRPDLTIPTCQWQVESGNAYPARLCYNGLVFRHQPPAGGRRSSIRRASSFSALQDRTAGEAEMMTLGGGSLARRGLENFEMKVGDLGLFAALVDALDIPAQWRGRLKRHFWRTGYFEALLARMVAGRGQRCAARCRALARPQS